jgi:hypothetical protein
LSSAAAGAERSQTSLAVVTLESSFPAKIPAHLKAASPWAAFLLRSVDHGSPASLRGESSTASDAAMTNDPKDPFEAISPAADTAVALARLFQARSGSLSYYAQSGGLGFGYMLEASGELRVVVEWQGRRCLQVTQPPQSGALRVIQPFDEGGPWIQELTDTLRDLEQVGAAERAEPSGKPS